MVAWRIASSVRTPRSCRARPSVRLGRLEVAGRVAWRGIIDLTIQYNSRMPPVNQIEHDGGGGSVSKERSLRQDRQKFEYGRQVDVQSAALVQAAPSPHVNWSGFVASRARHELGFPGHSESLP
jgi:hypothetical protein